MQESNDENAETPYQEDYLPAGLHEAEAGNVEEAETTVEEINEKLLDDEEEEVVEDERSWKRRANDADEDWLFAKSVCVINFTDCVIKTVLFSFIAFLI